MVYQDSAKDLDDALSISMNEDGTYEVGVHIADVSNFVRLCPLSIWRLRLKRLTFLSLFLFI